MLNAKKIIINVNQKNKNHNSIYQYIAVFQNVTRFELKAAK